MVLTFILSSVGIGMFKKFVSYTLVHMCNSDARHDELLLLHKLFKCN